MCVATEVKKRATNLKRFHYIILFLLFSFICVFDAKAQCLGPLESSSLRQLAEGVGTPFCQPGSVVVDTPNNPENPIPVGVTFSGGVFVHSCFSPVNCQNLYEISSNFSSLFCETSTSPTLTITFSQPVTNVTVAITAGGPLQPVIASGGGVTFQDTLGDFANHDIAFFFQTPLTSLTITTLGRSDGSYFFYMDDITFNPIIPSTPAAGNIVTSPASAASGATVNLTGSSWTAVASGAYKLLFDGNLVAQQSPLNSCADQPNLNFDVPCGATVGNHTLTVQLTNSSNQVLAFKQLSFAVVAPALAGLAATSCQNIRIESVMFAKLDGTTLELNPRLGNEITVNRVAYGGGVRFFPDALSSSSFSAQRSVKVRAKVTPATPGVAIYFRSFDVDDSSGLFNNTNHTGDDNQEGEVRLNGQAKNGFFTGVPQGMPTMKMTDSNGIAEVEFNVTMQPGDNFKIAASTRQNFVDSLTISGQRIMNGNTALPQQPDPNQPAIAPAESVVSQLLTVWRRLHVEVDSMDPPSLSSADANSNFVSCDIKTISSNKNDIDLGLYESNTNNLDKPVDLNLPNRILDNSPNLSGATNPTLSNPGLGNGRYENGTIRIGDATQSITINPITGNGTNFVRFTETKTNNIPFTLEDSTMANRLEGSIQGLDFTNRQFTLSKSVGKRDYTGGTLTIVSRTFRVMASNGSTITVEGDPSLPLMGLADDDKAVSPFLTATPFSTGQEDPAFDLMRNSDVPTMNLFAKAYVKPLYDVPGQTIPFIRNYQSNKQLTSQLNTNQSLRATPDYWFVYVQSAFQGQAFFRDRNKATQVIESEIGDADPLSEVLSDQTLQRSAVLGETPAGADEAGNILIVIGSALYIETLRDQAINANFDCKTISTVHEVGHQFALGHTDPQNEKNNPGIMDLSCDSKTVKEFIKSHLMIIRNSQRPQKGYNN